MTLYAPQTTTARDERDPGKQRFELPLLYLHRQREAAVAYQRFLIINIAGFDRPTELKLEAVSHHVNVATGEPHTVIRSAVTPQRACTVENPCPFLWTFDATTTPSDLYNLRIKDELGKTLWENGDRPAFAMLDTWDVLMSAERGQTKDYTVRITYATLFPFAKGENDLDNRLAPDQVTDFVERHFAPIIQDTWHTQAQEWGFGDPLHPEWDADGIVDVIVTDLPFALFGGTGTYSRFVVENERPYPERRIWWFSSNLSFQAYDALEDGFRVLFAHEFFHLMQWNVLLHTGKPGDFWLSWIEAQGRFAPSVQYPELELNKDHLIPENSTYTDSANRFLTQHLNTSYAELAEHNGFKYDGALYWRFLYEQYGGMPIVRAALEEMPHYTNAGSVIGMAGALEAAFARTPGPFDSFEESLITFSRANYALRLETGRCSNQDVTRCDGRYYDPAGMYTHPRLEAELTYDGTELSYGGDLPTSYGIDLIEVNLDSSVQGQALRLEFRADGPAARFSVQVWQLGRGYANPRPATPAPEIVRRSEDGVHRSFIPQMNTSTTSRLALIVTRLDADEMTEPVGGYQVTVSPMD